MQLILLHHLRILIETPLCMTLKYNFFLLFHFILNTDKNYRWDENTYRNGNTFTRIIFHYVAMEMTFFVGDERPKLWNLLLSSSFLLQDFFLFISNFLSILILRISRIYSSFSKNTQNTHTTTMREVTFQIRFSSIFFSFLIFLSFS